MVHGLLCYIHVYCEMYVCVYVCVCLCVFPPPKAVNSLKEMEIKFS